MLEKNDGEIAENKLLLLYILKFAGNMFTRESLINFILKNNYLNYFLVVQYLYELEKSDLIEYSDGHISTTDEGNTSIEIFKDRLDPALPDKIQRDLESFDWDLPEVDSLEPKYSIDSYKDTIVLNLMLLKKDQMIFNLNISLMDMEKAYEFGEKWMLNPKEKIDGIIKIISE